MAQFTLRLPDDLVPQVDAAAQNLGVSRTVFIARTLAGAVRDDTHGQVLRGDGAAERAPAEAKSKVGNGPARPASTASRGASRPAPQPCRPGCRGGNDHHARCPNHPKFA